MRNFQGGFRKAPRALRVTGVGFTQRHYPSDPKDNKGTEPERHFTPVARATPDAKHVVVPLTDRGYGREVMELE